MPSDESYVFSRYCQAWRMWNSWLTACLRTEIEFEQFIENGFQLIDNYHDGRYGYVVGPDENYYVEIGTDALYISYNGRPRFTWFPFTVSYGNLEPHECTPDCRIDLRPRLVPTLNVRNHRDT